MANCEICKGKEAKTPETIPYMAHEFAMVRMERQVKRLWIALIVCICFIFASNAAWLYAWMQYDYESYEITADGDSNANYIGQDGNIYNGSEDFGTEAETQDE